MDTTQDPKKKNEKSEPISEKPSQGNTTDDMAEDLKSLPEIDYDDPEVQRWVTELDEKWRKNQPRFSQEAALANAKIMEKGEKGDQ